MTTPREIISNALAVGKADGHPNVPRYIIDRLTTAGFRVLGPDEVDQVTLERAAEVAANWGSEIPAAIRALGRRA